MTVVRNAMASKALDALGLKTGALLSGTNAIVYGGESIVDLVKELVEQAKKIEKLKIKGSVVDGQLLDDKATKALAKLPNKKELQAIISGQIIGVGRKLSSQFKATASKLAERPRPSKKKPKKRNPQPPPPPHRRRHEEVPSS